MMSRYILVLIPLLMAGGQVGASLTGGDLSEDDLSAQPELEEAPFAASDLPGKWEYTSLVGNPIQDAFGGLVGVFDHENINMVVVKLHEAQDVSIEVFMADLLAKRMRQGQASIEVENRVLPSGVRQLKRQRSFGDLPIYTVIYEIALEGQAYYLEVDTMKSIFDNHQSEIEMLAQRLHLRSNN
ncbi:MAG: hypothetical protein HRT45_11970 [Bdellovibrionales bacterium]|nr:hypothetical protein [Bdellovibrionales bacterium]